MTLADRVRGQIEEHFGTCSTCGALRDRLVAVGECQESLDRLRLEVLLSQLCPDQYERFGQLGRVVRSGLAEVSLN